MKVKLLISKIRLKILDVLLMFVKYKNEKKYLIFVGRILLGYKMDLDNPKTLNEKLNYYKLNYKNELLIKCADKWTVREYIREKGLSHILVEDYGVYDDLKDIKLENLPDKFIAKNTGDSGGVVICKDKNKFFDIAKKKFKNLHKDYSNKYKEWHYHQIKNKIIIEKIIETSDNHSPKDYKFFCFNGEPKFLFVASERDIDTKFDFFDLEWNHIPVVQGNLNSKNNIEKPALFEEMLEICGILSKDFPHVRVDLYYEDGKIYFGELTFFNFAGLTPFYPSKYDYKFGEFFDVSKF